MSQIPLISEVPSVSARYSPPRTWSGVLEGAEHATRHLHLVAFPCEKCNGPVILGWIGTREDYISKETDIKEVGALCLSCGSRPETPTDSLQGRHFRPVEWEWTINKKSDAIEYGGDSLPADLSQDCRRPIATRQDLPRTRA